MASHLRMSGVDLLTIGEILGHRDLRMTKRYAHIAPAHKLAAVGLLEASFRDPETGSTTAVSPETASKWQQKRQQPPETALLGDA